MQTLPHCKRLSKLPFIVKESGSSSTVLELLNPTMVWIYPDYIEIDHHGRGYDKIFGEGSEKKTLRLAKIHQKLVFEKRAQQKVTEYVDCDLYGRGDPRVFGENAHLANKEEALTSLKKVREKSGKKEKFRAVLVFPSFSPFLFGKRLGSEKVQPAKIAPVITHGELLRKKDAREQLKVPGMSEVTLLQPNLVATDDESTVLVEIPWEESTGPLKLSKSNIRKRITLLEETETEAPSSLTKASTISKKVQSPANAGTSKQTFTPKVLFKEKVREKNFDKDTVSFFQDGSPIKEKNAISGLMETVDNTPVKVKNEVESSLDIEVSSTDSEKLGTDSSDIIVSDSSQSSGSSKEYKSCTSSKDECENESAKLISSDRGATVLDSTSESPAEPGPKLPAVTEKQRVIDLDRLGESGESPSSAPIFQNEISRNHTELKLGAAGTSTAAPIGLATAFAQADSNKSDSEIEESCTTSSEEMINSDSSDVVVSDWSQKSSKSADTERSQDVPNRTSSKTEFDNAEARQMGDTTAFFADVDSHTLSEDAANTQHDETEKTLTGQASISGGEEDEDSGVAEGIVERNLALFGNNNASPVQPHTTGALGPSASSSTLFAATLQFYNPLAGMFNAFEASASANEAAPTERAESSSDAAASVPVEEVINPPQQGITFAPFKLSSEAMETLESPTTPDVGTTFKHSASEVQNVCPKTDSSSSEVALSSSNDTVSAETVESSESEGSSGIMNSKSSGSAVNKTASESRHEAISARTGGPSVLDGVNPTSFRDNMIVADESSSSEHGPEKDANIAASPSSASSSEVNLSSSNGTPSAKIVDSSESASKSPMADSASWSSPRNSSGGKAGDPDKRDDGAVSKNACLSVSDSAGMSVSSSSEAAVFDSTGAAAPLSSEPAVSDSSTEAGKSSDCSDVIVSSSSEVEKSGSESVASSDEFCDVVDNEDDLLKFMSS